MIDSADLPLNVSREILQESRDVRAIREGSAKRILSLLEDRPRTADDYAAFWAEFGRAEGRRRRGSGQPSASPS